MKFALVENQKREAEKGLKGICPMCGQAMRPKCGQHKANHWAHISCKHCDSWWENETEWHRHWKDMFPIEWQEIISYDKRTGEKHIADIKTNMGSVVEFQHSNISDEERISREVFYKNMIWIVDGTRRKNDFKHFLNAFEYGLIWPTDPTSPLYILEFPNSHLPKEWLNSTVPVLFDFKGLLDKDTANYDNIQLREPLWCQLPIIGEDKRVLMKCPRDRIVQKIQNGGFKFNIDAIINEANQAIKYRRRMMLMGGYY